MGMLRYIARNIFNLVSHDLINLFVVIYFMLNVHIKYSSVKKTFSSVFKKHLVEMLYILHRTLVKSRNYCNF